jgi:hypothetical protein
MYSVQNDTRMRSRQSSPSDELRIGVTFKRPTDNIGPTKMAARLSDASVSSFVPDPLQMDRAIHELHQRGFTLTRRGQLTVSVRGSRQQFEKVFGTKLKTFRLQRSQNADAHAFYFPPTGAPWNPDSELMKMIDDAYIQWPHIYMAKAAKGAKKKAPGKKRKTGAAAGVRGSTPRQLLPSRNAGRCALAPQRNAGAPCRHHRQRRPRRHDRQRLCP